MKEKQKMPRAGFVVIRCDDKKIVARLNSFPMCERALMYRCGELVSFMPLRSDDIIGTPTLFSQMLDKSRTDEYYQKLTNSDKMIL